MKKLIPLLFALALAAAAAPVAHADEAMVVSVKRLTLETALKIAQGTIAACRAKGIQVGVTVVDRNGIPQVTLRDVLAPELTLEVSFKKAYTAASFMADTAALVGRFEGAYSVGKAEKLIISAGGLPIDAGGMFYGGVGVSGAPSGKTDAECAQAGIDTVRADLEMAGM